MAGYSPSVGDVALVLRRFQKVYQRLRHGQYKKELRKLGNSVAAVVVELSDLRKSIEKGWSIYHSREQSVNTVVGEGLKLTKEIDGFLKRHHIGLPGKVGRVGKRKKVTSAFRMASYDWSKCRGFRDDLNGLISHITLLKTSAMTSSHEMLLEELTADDDELRSIHDDGLSPICDDDLSTIDDDDSNADDDSEAGDDREEEVYHSDPERTKINREKAEAEANRHRHVTETDLGWACSGDEIDMGGGQRLIIHRMPANLRVSRIRYT